MICMMLSVVLLKTTKVFSQRNQMIFRRVKKKGAGFCTILADMNAVRAIERKLSEFMEQNAKCADLIFQKYMVK